MSSSLQARSAFALSKLLHGWVQVAPAEERWITGLTLDSREASVGSLFCALRGTRRHGL
jgi:UDP-N-acetylmuramyl pentapeptide synthase